MATEVSSERQNRREVSMNVYGHDGAALLATLAGDEQDTVADTFNRARTELGFSEDTPLCLTRRIRGGDVQEAWESIPENATLGEISTPDDQVDVAVDEDAQLGAV